MCTRSPIACFILLLALILPLCGGCASDRAVIDQANQMHSGLQPAVMTDRELNLYLQSIGDRIIDAARGMDQAHIGPQSHLTEDASWMFDEKRMAFHFVNSQTLNAFTTGGEHMYIYTKLFQTCKTEDELAAVMAHEYAHVYSRHVHKGMNRQYALIAGAGVLAAGGYAAGGKEHGTEYAGAGLAAGLIAGRFIGMSFTRGDEAEADEYGFDFYTRAGWDPKHFGDFFQRMVDMGMDKTPEFLSDHPSLASRKALADQRAGKVPSNASQWRKPPVWQKLGHDFTWYQQRTKDIGKTMPTDKSLEKAQLMLAAIPRSCWSPVQSEDEKHAQDKLLAELQPQNEVNRPKDRGTKAKPKSKVKDPDQG